MDLEQIQKYLSTPPDTRKGFFVSTSMLNKLKETTPHRKETPNISQTFLGFEIKEDKFMPENMMAIYNGRNQIIGVIKIENDKIIYSEIDPADFYKIPVFLKEQDNE